jgi:hypothetical protein
VEAAPVDDPVIYRRRNTSKKSRANFRLCIPDADIINAILISRVQP